MFLLGRFARGRFSMKDLKQAATMLDAAGRDFSALRAMGDNPDFADEIFGFHTQQAAQKSFKAWLSLLGEEYPLTHNLVLLLDILARRDTDAMRFKALADYGPYAVQIRYMADPDTRPLDRGVALEHLEALMEHVQSVFARLREANDDE